MKIHQCLTQERWNSFSLFEQLANVGMDIERTIMWRDQGNREYSYNAFVRALELLDMTIADPKHKGPRLKELVRTREALADYFVFDNEYGSNDKIWQDYFYQFNYAAALEKGR